jgi:hypothetical protein
MLELWIRVLKGHSSMTTYNRNMPHPATLTSSEWATPHEAVAPVQLVQNVFHLAGGFLGNMFNSTEVGTSWDETRYFHYCNTDRPWKAASLYRQFRRSTLRDIKVDGTVQWYLNFLDKTGEFAPRQEVRRVRRQIPMAMPIAEPVYQAPPVYVVQQPAPAPKPETAPSGGEMDQMADLLAEMVIARVMARGYAVKS